MAKWNVHAKGIEQIVTYTRGEDTLVTKQWWRYATWEVKTDDDDDNPPVIECDTDMNDVPYHAKLLDAGDFKGSMDYTCTCDLSKDEDGGLNADELNQPEDFDWDIDENQLWIRTNDIDIDLIEDENVINNREEENIINNSEDEVNSHIRKTIRVDLPPGYKPSQKADTREQYMSLYQLEYFRRILLAEQRILLDASQGIDMSSVNEETLLRFRNRGVDLNSIDEKTLRRCSNLLYKIENLLKDIDDGNYGYCVDTGEEIGIKRLLSVPTAERTIEAQARWVEEQKKNNN
jgi:RNA polymerase-binding protein DksA